MPESTSMPELPLPLHTTSQLVGRHRRNYSRQRHPESPGTSAENNDEAQVQTVTDVRAWLEGLGYGQYADVFTINEINGAVLKTLTSEELRDDLTVVNLRHRRGLLDAIAKLVSADTTLQKDPLPEHGRILDHLSNVRTYHSWIRVGIQLLGFSIVNLRLAPDFRETPIVAAASFYFACIGIIALLYGIYRYRAVILMIERSGPSMHHYTPDRIGVLTLLTLVLVASVLALTVIALRQS